MVRNASLDLLVCFDGTACSPCVEHQDNPTSDTSDLEPDCGCTNTRKFAEFVRCRAGNRFRVFYSRGVGQSFDLGGLLWGEGSRKLMERAYTWLSRQYRSGYSKESSKLYLCGYSRGGMIAVGLAAVVAHYGVPKDPERVSEILDAAFATPQRQVCLSTNCPLQPVPEIWSYPRETGLETEVPESAAHGEPEPMTLCRSS